PHRPARGSGRPGGVPGEPAQRRHPRPEHPHRRWRPGRADVTPAGARPPRPAVLRHLPWRIAGLTLLAVLVVAYQPDRGDVVNRLAIPVAMALATWMLVQNAAAVA